MNSVNISSTVDPVFEKIGNLSRAQRILICVSVFVLLIGAFAYFSYLPKISQIKDMTEQYEQLGAKLSSSRIQAAQLERYREKREKAEDEFKIVLKKLPEKKDIPSLLASISQSGKESGLDFILFQPEAEQSREFYAEIPVSIQVEGNYHNVAQFFDNVSILSRIVNIKDIRMVFSPKEGKLLTSCKAVTYRFISDPVKDEKQPSNQKNK
ncbi:MAG: type 4a pilus biogenesis protein PilO [Desulfobacterales bacterium]|nr:type 4a pilus biogenesis protein PilO [Desulfobacterales bacterium]MDD4070949.1 type 4a pilus biogenesis protein PilO [Desulfobacterales bacterium]MDD4393425.1 type 4a pilus biogenesis protein PilO [Desulfobacterales bacterium]